MFWVHHMGLVVGNRLNSNVHPWPRDSHHFTRVILFRPKGIKIKGGWNQFSHFVGRQIASTFPGLNLRSWSSWKFKSVINCGAVVVTFNRARSWRKGIWVSAKLSFLLHSEQYLGLQSTQSLSPSFTTIRLKRRSMSGWVARRYLTHVEKQTLDA